MISKIVCSRSARAASRALSHFLITALDTFRVLAEGAIPQGFEP